MFARVIFICLMLATLLSARWATRLTNAGAAPDPVTFEDVAARSGVNFVLRNSAAGRKHLLETMIGGVAVLDYNNDGKLDLYFVNGARLPEMNKTDASYHNRLYRNNGQGSFTDLTAQAGVSGEGYEMGAAAADYDNDGFADLFLPGVGRNVLYRNRGDGTFEDVTSRAGLQDGKSGQTNLWSVAAGWFDYDNDGFLDLFVVRYVNWDPEREPTCGETAAKLRTYCHPRYYAGLPNSLYRNNRDGTFSDVSVSSGIASFIGKGMSVAFADYDADGDQDIFVTNDTIPNFLFRNEGGSRFSQVALQAGVAFNEDGRALSSMGVDFRDYDNDGRDDLFITALANETFPLFRNLGQGLFDEVTFPARVGRATVAVSGWSNGVFDFNNDGYKDLFIANGDVQDNTELYSSRQSRQPNSILVNQRDGTFADFSRHAGPQFQAVGMHRGAAFGDFDGDGRVDVVVTRLNERAELFRNTSPASNHWLALRLVGSRSNRDGIGARVRVVSASGHVQLNHVATAVGYSSSSAAAVHFGLGKDALVKVVEITWPSGVLQRIENVAVDRYLVVREPFTPAK
jgi:enediyne biosynthesis protein E4